VKSLNLPSAFPHQATLVFTDVDETLTWQGRLPVETFQALFALQQAGIRVVPVTGACAGWCECMLRTWPIDSIIGENGAFYIDRHNTGKLTYTYALPEAERVANTEYLQQLQQDVIKAFPETQLTTDQSFRLTDMAFDIGQDYQMERAQAQRIAEFCRSAGANAKVGPIHINVWLGQYTKASTSLHWLSQHKVAYEDTLFCGDSPNDDSMFASFPITIGVANVEPFLDEIEKPPTYITNRPGGFGFADLAASLLTKQPN
jgi:HAD superfamily hydrolase (TIGR01484 family)